MALCVREGWRGNDLSVTASCATACVWFQVPPNGLVVYTGTIMTDDGKEKKVNIDFEPFKPINTSLYLCDNKFHTEALNELLESDNKCVCAKAFLGIVGGRGRGSTGCGRRVWGEGNVARAALLPWGGCPCCSSQGPIVRNAAPARHPHVYGLAWHPYALPSSLFSTTSSLALPPYPAVTCAAVQVRLHHHGR